MKRTKLTPEQLVEAGRIERSLAATVRNMKASRDEDKQKAATWWEEQIEAIGVKFLRQSER